jgi:hypothetical protein
MSLGKLFGGGESTDALKNWQSPFVNPGQLNSALSDLSTPSTFLKGFSGGGLTGSYDANGNANVTSSAGRQDLISQLSGIFTNQASKLGDLLTKVAPGFSDMRSAYLTDNTNRATAAVSNLRDNLNARRILGSSFAQDAVNRTNATFGDERAKTLPQIYLQELAATNDLLNQQSAASAQAVQTNIGEANLQAGVAGQLQQQASQAIANATAIKAQILGSLAQGAQSQQGANMRTAAELDEKAASGAGGFFGDLLGMGAKAILGAATGGAAPALGSWLTTVSTA